MELLPTPKKFDWNEWFLLCSSVGYYGLMMILPRRFPFLISFLLFMFGLYFARSSDHIIGTIGALDLYDINDTNQMEIYDVITYPLYGAASYLFIYIYDKFRIRGWVTVVYVIAWALLSVAEEYIAMLFHVFTYIKWNLFYSFLFYLAVQPLTIAFYSWIKRLYARMPYLD